MEIILLVISFLMIAYCGFRFVKLRKKMNPIKIKGELVVEIGSEYTYIYSKNNKSKRHEYETKFLFDLNRNHSLSMSFSPAIYQFGLDVEFIDKPIIHFVIKTKNYSLLLLDDSNYTIASIVVDSESEGSLNKKDDKLILIDLPSEHDIKELVLDGNVGSFYHSFASGHVIENFAMVINEENKNLQSNLFNSSNTHVEFGNAHIKHYYQVGFKNLLKVAAKEIKVDIHYPFIDSEDKIKKIIQAIGSGNVVHAQNTELNIIGKAMDLDITFDEFEEAFGVYWKRASGKNFIIKNNEKVLLNVKNAKVLEYELYDKINRKERLKYFGGLIVGYEYD